MCCLFTWKVRGCLRSGSPGSRLGGRDLQAGELMGAGHALLEQTCEGAGLGRMGWTVMQAQQTSLPWERGTPVWGQAFRVDPNWDEGTRLLYPPIKPSHWLRAAPAEGLRAIPGETPASDPPEAGAPTAGEMSAVTGRADLEAPHSIHSTGCRYSPQTCLWTSEVSWKSFLLSRLTFFFSLFSSLLVSSLLFFSF